MPNYLIHHGIRGQKLGIRNGPPYPLSERVISKAQNIKSIIDSVSRMTIDSETINDLNSYGRKSVSDSGLLKLDLQYFAERGARSKLESNDHAITWDTKPRQMSKKQYEILVDAWNRYSNYPAPSQYESFDPRLTSDLNQYLISSERGSKAFVRFEHGDFWYDILNGGYNKYRVLDFGVIS